MMMMTTTMMTMTMLVKMMMPMTMMMVVVVVMTVIVVVGLTSAMHSVIQSNERAIVRSKTTNQPKQIALPPPEATGTWRSEPPAPTPPRSFSSRRFLFLTSAAPPLPPSPGRSKYNGQGGRRLNCANRKSAVGRVQEAHPQTTHTFFIGLITSPAPTSTPRLP